MSDQSASNHHCFICAGADDDPDFDECAVCGRKGVPLPYGGPAPLNRPPMGAAMHRPATGLDPNRPGESGLARGIRLARGIPDPEDVPGILQAIGRALSSEAQPVSPTEGSASALPPDEPLSEASTVLGLRGDSSVADSAGAPAFGAAADGLRKSEGARDGRS